MKRVLPLILILLTTTPACLAQSERELQEQLLTPGMEAVQAMKNVLESSQKHSAKTLYLSAAVAQKESRIEDAAFLFYIARFRVAFDTELFPPSGTGGDSPLLELKAFQSTTGGTINPSIMKSPADFAATIRRVKAWMPSVDGNYDPAWNWQLRGDEAKALVAMEKRRKPFIAKMEGLAKLFANKEYHQAFMEEQTRNLSGDASSKELRGKSLEIMRRIEKEMGISGIASDLEKSRL